LLPGFQRLLADCGQKLPMLIIMITARPIEQVRACGNRSRRGYKGRR
jgi:hypothetical protein